MITKRRRKQIKPEPFESLFKTWCQCYFHEKHFCSIPNTYSVITLSLVVIIQGHAAKRNPYYCKQRHIWVRWLLSFFGRSLALRQHTLLLLYKCYTGAIFIELSSVSSWTWSTSFIVNHCRPLSRDCKRSFDLCDLFCLQVTYPCIPLSVVTVCSRVKLFIMAVFQATVLAWARAWVPTDCLNSRKESTRFLNNWRCPKP